MPSTSVEQQELSTGAALLSSPVRRNVVDELASLDGADRAAGLTAAELAQRLELHTTTIRFHVDQLVAAGILDAHFVRSGGVGRPSKKYVLREHALGTTAADAAGNRPFEVLAGLLAATLAPAESDRLTPEEAGERWALRRAQEAWGDQDADAPPEPTDRGTRVDLAIGLLGEWGYTPHPEQDPERPVVDVMLRDCPFLDLARSHPHVVCGVHRGLLRGALTAVGEPDARVSLEPFIGPDVCRARLYLSDDDQRSSRP